MSDNTFQPEQLFGSKTRTRLLSLFLLHEDEDFFVRELTRKIDAQLNSVRRELKKLMTLGIICEKKEKRIPKSERKSLSDKKRYYTANQDCILFEDLRSFYKKVQILLKQNLVDEIQQKGDIAYLAFMGRFVDDDAIPTDIMLIGEIASNQLKKLIKKFEQEFGHEINYTLIPKSEVEYRQQVKDRFLNDMLQAEKIVMVNKLDL